MDAVPDRPRPTPDALTEGFWAAARRGELVIQRCGDCRAFRHYPQPMCAACHSTRWAWTPVSGRGVVYTFTVTYRAFHPAWADRLPFVVATVELEEEVRIVTDLPREDVADVAIGRPVECFFEQQPGSGADAFAFPRFRLLR